MYSIDNVLHQLQHHDRQRSQLLRAMESKAASASSSVLSIENYFQTEKQRAVRATRFKPGASHNPGEKPCIKSPTRALHRPM